MTLKLFQIDSFTNEIFKGNPAAVCPLDNWLSNDLMQKIAAENNLSETAFFIKDKDNFAIRWFTPNQEVNLCGHATLAAAYVIFFELNYQSSSITFNSKSGKLAVTKNSDNSLTLDFPLMLAKKCDIDEIAIKALKAEPKEAYFAGEDYIFIYEKEETIKNINPDFNLLKELN